MDVKRLRKVHERMMGFGDPIHYSVFVCRLTGRGRVELKAARLEIMDPDKDRIMIIDMGPAEGRVEERIEFLGVAPPGSPRRKYIIVSLFQNPSCLQFCPIYQKTSYVQQTPET